LKLLKENIGKIPQDTRTSNNFLNRTPAAQEIRTRTDKRDYIKLKSFCTAKKTNTRMKRQLTECKKIFTSYSYDKGLISRIYKEFKNLNTKRTNNPINKWTNELNRQFLKEVQMPNKYMKTVQHP
jgi:hypothetical protein